MSPVIRMVSKTGAIITSAPELESRAEVPAETERTEEAVRAANSWEAEPVATELNLTRRTAREEVEGAGLMPGARRDSTAADRAARVAALAAFRRMAVKVSSSSPTSSSLPDG